MRRLLPALLLLAGCAADGQPPDTEAVVMSRLGFVMETDEGVSDGFDLDGIVTAQGDPSGCGVADFTTPDGVPGVDNSFAPIVPALEAVGGDALPQLVQNSIYDGELLIVVEMVGLDDPMNDACVDLHLSRGTGGVAIGTDGELLPGQTFERDLEQPDSWVECASVSNGVLHATDFGMRLPLNVFDEFIDLTLVDGLLEMELQDDGSWQGLFAGGVDTAEVSANVHSLDGIDDEIPVLVDTIMDVRADLEGCSRISVTFEFTALSAFFYEDAAE